MMIYVILNQAQEAVDRVTLFYMQLNDSHTSNGVLIIKKRKI